MEPIRIENAAINHAGSYGSREGKRAHRSQNGRGTGNTARDPDAEARRGIDLVVRSVEAVGWDCVGVDQFMYSINMAFVRTG